MALIVSWADILRVERLTVEILHEHVSILPFLSCAFRVSFDGNIVLSRVASVSVAALSAVHIMFRPTNAELQTYNGIHAHSALIRSYHIQIQTIRSQQKKQAEKKQTNE